MISISPEEFRPLIDAAVQAALDKQVREDAIFRGRLAFSETEFAMLVGVKPHTIRDERLRGRVKGIKVGKSYRYSTDEIKRYLRGERK
ncbi:helix-turn-helix domain-containing protein [bacterium]|nr:helix-turn-helix domain-containing protein [bacterium]